MVVDGHEIQQELIINQIDEAGLGRHTTPLLFLIEKIKNDFQLDSVNDIEFISSGGSCVVVAVHSHNHNKLENQVFQYYEDPLIFEKIRQMYKAVEVSRDQVFNVCAMTGHSYNSPRLQINYDLTNFLVKPVDWYPELQTIVWDKIQPVSHLSSTWLMSHIEHIIWDIGKAIAGLHSIGYSHGDVRMDNIGWDGQRFILYDFNMTKPYQISQYSNDYFTFGMSVREVLQVNTDYLIPLSKVDYQFFLSTLKRGNSHFTEKGSQTYEQVVAFLERSTDTNLMNLN